MNEVIKQLLAKLIVIFMLSQNLALAQTKDCTEPVYSYREVPGLTQKRVNNVDYYSGVIEEYLHHRRGIATWSKKCNRSFDMSRLSSVEKIYSRVRDFMSKRLLKPSGYNLAFRGGVVIIEIDRPASFESVNKSLANIRLFTGLKDDRLLQLLLVSNAQSVAKKLRKATLLFLPGQWLIGTGGERYKKDDEFAPGWTILQINYDSVKFSKSDGQEVVLQR